MPDKYKALRDIIDSQDKARIETFINENPDLDYNSIAPNGASVLWWALMPPKDKDVSRSIVEWLLQCKKINGDALVNPTKTLGGLRPETYLSFSNKQSFRSLMEIIMTAENRYEGPQANTERLADLAHFAADAQSSHDSRVAKLARDNTARLYEHYVNSGAHRLDTETRNVVYGEIKNLISGVKLSKTDAEQRQKGLDFCFQDRNRFAFLLNSEDKSSEFTLSLAELVALNWIAAKEKQADFLPYDANNAESCKNRKQALLNILYDIATAYGRNHPSCAGGACNRLGMTLAAQHSLVYAFNKDTKLGGELAGYIITRILSGNLMTLAQENPDAYWSVLRYLTFPLKAGTEEKEAYQVFIKEKKAAISKQLEDEWVVETLIDDTVNALEDAYPFACDRNSYFLSTLMRLMKAMQEPLPSYQKAVSLEASIEAMLKQVTEKLKESDTFKQLIASFEYPERLCRDNAFIERFIKNWMEQTRLKDSDVSLDYFFKAKGEPVKKTNALKAFASKLPEEQRKKTLERMAREEARQVKEKEQAHSAFTKEITILALFTMQKEDLKAQRPAQAQWLDTLNNTAILRLMHSVNKDFHYPSDGKNADLVQGLVLSALDKGMLSNLNLEGMHFKDKDLRAYDFSGANLNNVRFENCLLPVTEERAFCKNIQFIHCDFLPYVSKEESKEPSARGIIFYYSYYNYPRRPAPSALMTAFCLQNLQAEGLKTIHHEQTLLMIAASHGYKDMVNAILESDYCSPELLKQHTRGYTALVSAALHGHTEIVKTILESKYFSKELLGRTIYSVTPLLAAARSGYTETVKILLENKYCSLAVLNAKDFDGKNARSGANTKIISRLIDRYMAYQKLWESAETPDEKIIAILNDYCKGTIAVFSTLSVFAHGHFRRHHVQEVRSIVEEYKTEYKDTAWLMQKIAALKNLENINPTGSLYNRLRFIESRLDPDIETGSELTADSQEAITPNKRSI